MKKKREKKELDYLLIPTGWEEQRKERTMKELEQRSVKNIYMLAGCNSEEDIFYLGKMLETKEKGKKILRMGIVTFPLHYIKYRMIIKRAQKQGIFPKNAETENVRTEESFKQTIYGILGLIEDIFNERHLDEKSIINRNNTWLMKHVGVRLKEFLKRHM